MRIFKNKWFAKFAKKEGISDEKLIQAIGEVDSESVDADYGGGVSNKGLQDWRKENRAVIGR